jgi:hypothetical protein
MRTLLVMVCLFSWPLVGAAAEDELGMWGRAGGPRVRPGDTRSATLLRNGLNRSPTLRALVDRVESSDVIVYLEVQPKLQRRLAGCVTWVASTPKYRYVRASISPDQTADRQIVAIAHELQHVLEIIEHPRVNGDRALLDLYRRIGDPRAFNSTQWDTTTAREVGFTVGRELAMTPVAGTARLNDPLSPNEWHAWYLQQRVTY